MADISEMPFLFRLKREWPAFLYLSPMIAFVIALDLYPIAYTIYISLTHNGPLDYQYVGTVHYVAAFTYELGLTKELIQNSFFLATVSIFIFVVVGICLATVLNQNIRGKTIYRTLILVPWAIPAYISLLTWFNMFNFQYGIINGLLHIVQIAPVNWLGKTNSAWAAIFIANTWLSFPYYTVVFLAQMQSIPADLYESASIDGASSLYKFVRITIPYIFPTIAFVAVLGWTFTFNNFYVIYLLTSGHPGNTTNIFIVMAYQLANASPFSFSLAAVFALMDFLVVVIVAFFAIKYTRLTEGWLK